MKIKTVVRLAASLVWTLSALGCDGASGDGGGGDLRCSAYYRSSVEGDTEHQALEEHLNAVNEEEQVAVLGEFRFSVLYFDDEYEGRELTVTVLDELAQPARTIERQLFQLSRDSAPVNEFEGDHGFTGLSYVYHPTASGELQYLCHSL